MDFNILKGGTLAVPAVGNGKPKQSPPEGNNNRVFHTNQYVMFYKALTDQNSGLVQFFWTNMTGFGIQINCRSIGTFVNFFGTSGHTT